MCAMIPMFRVFSSVNWRGMASRDLYSVLSNKNGPLGPARTSRSYPVRRAMCSRSPSWDGLLRGGRLVSASARGTTSNYSKGTALRRAGFADAARALAAVALAATALLLAAELSPLYTVVVGSLETPRRSVIGAARTTATRWRSWRSPPRRWRSARCAARARRPWRSSCSGRSRCSSRSRSTCPSTRQSGDAARGARLLRGARARGARLHARARRRRAALLVAAARAAGRRPRPPRGSRHRGPVDGTHRQREQRLPRRGVGAPLGGRPRAVWNARSDGVGRGGEAPAGGDLDGSGRTRRGAAAARSPGRPWSPGAAPASRDRTARRPPAPAASAPPTSRRSPTASSTTTSRPRRSPPRSRGSAAMSARRDAVVGLARAARSASP